MKYGGTLTPSSIVSSNIILFAWNKKNPHGGMEDCCGFFASSQAALAFFEESNHCKDMNVCQLFDCAERRIVWEQMKNA